MNGKLGVMVAVVVGAQLSFGSRAEAQEQGGGGLLDTVIQVLGSSKTDNSASDSDEHHHEGGKHHHSDSQSNDPDVVVKRAYEDILNRAPDQEGLRHYRSLMIDENWTEQDIRDDLRNSREHDKVDAASVDKVIQRAYQDILGRDADSSGLATYRARMMNDGWTEQDVRSNLKKSSEGREKAGVSTEQAQQMIRRAYQNALGREPDPGSSVYIEKIKKNHWNQGDVEEALRKSPEYRNKHKK
jgi:hypothetical protein